MTTAFALRRRMEQGKFDLIKELRADSEFLSGIKRGLEARRKGQMVSWNKVKAELGIS